MTPDAMTRALYQHHHPGNHWQISLTDNLIRRLLSTEEGGGREELSRLIHDHYIGFALLCFNLLHLQLLHDFSHLLLPFLNSFFTLLKNVLYFFSKLKTRVR